MKVNSELNKVVREYKIKCDKCEIHNIIDDKDYGHYSTIFDFNCFKEVNVGTRFKVSCIIRKTRYDSFIIEYYEGCNFKKIELFPSGIKQIRYK